ncbi:MAG: gamma-glutamyl-gamma-aminobutyrate hydrolase family protein [Pseudomonadales bacterium]
MAAKPLVLIGCDVKQVGIHPFHCVGEKYIDAVAHGADVWPLLLPALGAGGDLESLERHIDLDALLGMVDGVFLPGSVSNVAPEHYGATADPAMLQDPQRDALALPLIARAMALEVPLFAVCRGFQELNVVLGGSLHPRLHDVEAFLDHREDTDLARDDQYLHAHAVALRQGGVLERLLGCREIQVNSLHGQGIDRLAPGLVAEAVAPDGVIEAVSCPTHPGFLLGVQWHPEWHFRKDPASVAMFRAFGEAAAVRARERAR